MSEHSPSIPQTVQAQQYYKDQGLKAAGIQIEGILNAALGRESGLHGIWTRPELPRPSKRFIKAERRLKLKKRALEREGMPLTSAVAEDFHKNIHEIYDGFHPAISVVMLGPQEGEPHETAVPIQKGSEEETLLKKVESRARERRESSD